MALYDWEVVCAAVRSADRVVKRRGRKTVYSDQQVVNAALEDQARPAVVLGMRSTQLCRRLPPKQLPSVSQFCRRVRSPRVVAMIEHVSRHLVRPSRPIEVVSVDGKALPISGDSRDDDATNGWGTGRFQRGYKLHECVSDYDVFLGLQVHPMNVAEPTVAREPAAHAAQGAGAQRRPGQTDGHRSTSTDGVVEPSTPSDATPAARA